MISLLGIVVLLGIALLLSDNRKAINLRTVGGAFAIQASLAALILYVPVGKDILAAVAGGVQNVINYANDGVSFMFGDLANHAVGFIFAINVLPIIVFLSALMSVLYYLGIMQWVVKIFGTGLQKIIGTDPEPYINYKGICIIIGTKNCF